MSLLLLALALATASASGPTYAGSKAFAPAAMPKYRALFAVEPAESPAAVPVLPGAAGAHLKTDLAMPCWLPAYRTPLQTRAVRMETFWVLTHPLPGAAQLLAAEGWQPRNCTCRLTYRLSLSYT